MIRWQAIVAALVLFFAGVLSGVMGQRLWRSWQAPEASAKTARRGEPLPPGAGPHRGFLQRMTKDLELSPEQAKQVSAIIKASQKRMREIWKPVVAKARLEMSNTHHAIAAILNEKQRARMEELFNQRREQGRHGAGRFHSRGRSEKNPPAESAPSSSPPAAPPSPPSASKGTAPPAPPEASVPPPPPEPPLAPPAPPRPR